VVFGVRVRRSRAGTAVDSITRRYLIAPSFVRMLRGQGGYERAIEGHFPRQPARNSFVHIRSDGADLVLMSGSEDAQDEERTSVPRSHAEALLEVTAGAVVYERTRLGLPGGQIVSIDRFVRPADLDVATVDFRTVAERDSFAAPVWLGPEVGDAFAPRAVALDGVPPHSVVEPTNTALDALLDAVEAGFGRREEDSNAVPEPERLARPARSASAERESRPSRELREPSVVIEAAAPAAALASGAEADPAITSLRSIFAAQRSALVRQRQPVETN
jgi:CYTH domain-containing protein